MKLLCPLNIIRLREKNTHTPHMSTANGIPARSGGTRRICRLVGDPAHTRIPMCTWRATSILLLLLFITFIVVYALRRFYDKTIMI